MIPKIIHYCWFGGKEKPLAVTNYIKSWCKHLPDYEIREWNESNFDYKSWKFCKEAYRMKKFAFVADVCRVYALATIGGIYLDTDVEVVASFDRFLTNQSFVGLEDEGKINTGCMAAAPHTPWVTSFLETYRMRSFINWKGRDLSWPNSYLLKQHLQNSLSQPCIYPLDYFCAKHYTTGELAVTENTVCIHHYDGTWLKDNLSVNRRMKNLWIKIISLIC